jgi:hypothetical protein
MPISISSPRFNDAAIIGDDAVLAAMLCSRLAKPGEYLAVLEAPRMTRPDAQGELVFCNNTLARVGSTRHFFAGLEAETKIALRPFYKGISITDASSEDVIAAIPLPRSNGEIVWGRDNIGVGLLKAMRERKHLVFSDGGPTQTYKRGLNPHLVVVEDRDPLVQVIAANYAWSLGAGICIIPSVSKAEEDSILRDFIRLRMPHRQSHNSRFYGTLLQLCA